MIHVHITDQLPLVPGDQPLEVIVSHADAHADFPQTTRCPGSPNQGVSGHAFIGSETTSPAELPLLVGFVSIPSSGGHDHQNPPPATPPRPAPRASGSEKNGTPGRTPSG